MLCDGNEAHSQRPERSRQICHSVRTDHDSRLHICVDGGVTNNDLPMARRFPSFFLDRDEPCAVDHRGFAAIGDQELNRLAIRRLHKPRCDCNIRTRNAQPEVTVHSKHGLLEVSKVR